MTAAQYAALRADILANNDLKDIPNTSDGNLEVARLYNLQAVPTFVVWKTRVTVTEVGDNIVATELAGLTSLNTERLSAIALYSPNGLNPSMADRRGFFDDIFSGAGGTFTRPKLLALWKRTATRIEKLFATGTGSDASPATLSVEGPLSATDVAVARAS